MRRMCGSHRTFGAGFGTLKIRKLPGLLAAAISNQLLLPAGQVLHPLIHSHGEVRLDPLGHNGIYKPDQQRYTHKLRLIKRLLTE